MADSDDLSFEELIAGLENPTRGWPECYTINQIGKLLLESNKQAEEFLLLIVEEGQLAELRYIAHGLLTRKEAKLSEVGQARIKQFEQDPVNAELMEMFREGRKRREARLSEFN